jgi:hypothetical protein
VTHFRQVIAGKFDDRPETAFYTLSGLKQRCRKFNDERTKKSQMDLGFTVAVVEALAFGGQDMC